MSKGKKQNQPQANGNGSFSFYNPYNFVNTPKREAQDDFVGDYDPADPSKQENHSRYWGDRYTGTIPVRLRVQTPLFLTDPNSRKKAPNGHNTYDCLDYIPATTLKGMLSSAYEIITNSRYRVFSKKQQKKRLWFRSDPKSALKLKPGRVTQKDGKWFVTLFTGTNLTGNTDTLDAAWLPAYRNGNTEKLPENGKWYNGVTLKLYSYTNPKNNKKFTLWSVEEISGVGKYNPISENMIAKQETITVSGYAVISGKIFFRKHDERFFFNFDKQKKTNVEVIPLEITDKDDKDIIKRYEDLVADYRRVHEGGTFPPIGNGTVHGEHITGKGTCTLQDGCFVYVEEMDDGTVKALYPVQISRKLNDVAPWDCLDETLRPATAMKDLSPADRLFGWVAPTKDEDEETTDEFPAGMAQEGGGAWKGKVRISRGVFKESKDITKAVHKFSDPIILSILGTPKPAQARFYLGDEDGKPQKDRLSKEDAGYKEGKKLRGRKVYLHHRNLTPSSDEKKAHGKECYWEPEKGRDLNIRPEYLQADDERSNQNRSITGWIPKRAEFTFDIKVENVTREELGALLSLLDLGSETYFRLGYGKPLGFGSVSLSINAPDGQNIPVTKGSALKDRYKSIAESAVTGLSPIERKEIINDYKKVFSTAYGGGAKEVPPVDLFPWKNHEFTGLFTNKEELNPFRKSWETALRCGAKECSLDDIPCKEDVFEMYPDLQTELKDCYKKLLPEFQKQQNHDYGWSEVPMIKQFLLSMKGFDDAPVTYPRKSEERNSKGFDWFVANEKEKNDKVTHGHSLPAMTDESGRANKPTLSGLGGKQNASK